MKALQLTSYGDLKAGLVTNEVEKPTVQSGDVLIEVRAAAINPIDKIIAMGHLKGMLPIQLPAAVGYDVSGVVVAKGAKAASFEVGDEVYARAPQEQMGTLAEFAAVDSEAVSKRPKNISFEEAAGLPLAGLTALQSLQRAGIKACDRVLIHAGSGGVGSLAVQYAKAKGAYVYTTTSTDNVDWVKGLGADEVIDYKSQDYRTIVKGVDIVFDTLGQHYTLEAFDVVKRGGVVVSIAGPMGIESAKMLGVPNYELPEEITKIVAKTGATYEHVFMHPSGAHLREIKALVEAGDIKPIVDKVYPLGEAVEAFTHLDSGRAKGKIVISVRKG